MKPCVYKTTNLQNNKYYIGVHRTDPLLDGYLGSGVLIQKAILKYGKNNFKCEVLEQFETLEQAYQFEKELLTEQVLSDQMQYNINSGGKGNQNIGKIAISMKIGMHAMSKEQRQNFAKEIRAKQQKEEKARIAKLGADGFIKSRNEKRKIFEDSFVGPILPEEIKHKLSIISSEEKRKLANLSRSKSNMNIASYQKLGAEAARKILTGCKYYNDGIKNMRFYGQREEFNNFIKQNQGKYMTGYVSQNKTSSSSSAGVNG